MGSTELTGVQQRYEEYEAGQGLAGVHSRGVEGAERGYRDKNNHKRTTPTNTQVGLSMELPIQLSILHIIIIIVFVGYICSSVNFSIPILH